MNETRTESYVEKAHDEFGLNPKCSMHPEDDLFSFCDDCKIVLCDKCSVHHRNHTVRKEIMKDIVDIEKDAVANENRYMSQQDDLFRSMQMLEGSKKGTENQIEIFLQKIQERTKKQKAALHELFILQMPILTKREKIVSELIQCAKYMKMVARKTQFSSDEINPFAAYEKLQEKRKEVEKYKQDLQQNRVKDFYFSFQPLDPDRLYGQFQNKKRGIYQPKTAHPSKRKRSATKSTSSTVVNEKLTETTSPAVLNSHGVHVDYMKLAAEIIMQQKATSQQTAPIQDPSDI
ncbi:uncharacterized protein LOC133177180 [Saccostrea echinata]|uniref:uncharacterized protein LOC133177180 n=1 Tax=Saccostrea echinata TaxID=191078 RepID=UPI002A834364|nr:uncharacterized protein LOC133177180 [Saccostrea echinata]